MTLDLHAFPEPLMGEVCAASEEDIPNRAGIGDRFSRTVLKLNTHLPLLIRCDFYFEEKTQTRREQKPGERKSRSYILEQLEMDN